jgi:hypothetical protein
MNPFDPPQKRDDDTLISGRSPPVESHRISRRGFFHPTASAYVCAVQREQFAEARGQVQVTGRPQNMSAVAAAFWGSAVVVSRPKSGRSDLSRRDILQDEFGTDESPVLGVRQARWQAHRLMLR